MYIFHLSLHRQDAKAYAAEQNVMYLEASSKTGYNISQIFLDIGGGWVSIPKSS